MRFEIWVFVCCVMCISCHPLYGYNSMEGSKEVYRYRRNLDEDFDPDEYGHHIRNHKTRHQRSLESVVKKSSRGAISLARNIVKAFLPSAKQIGLTGMQRMVKRESLIPAKPDASKPNIAAPRMKIPTGYSMPSVRSPMTPLNYNYQYPGYHPAPFMGYGYPQLYNSYFYQPYGGYNGMYNNFNQQPYDYSKRMLLPYNAFSTSVSLQSQPITPSSSAFQPPLAPAVIHGIEHSSQAPPLSIPPAQFPFPSPVAAYGAVMQQRGNIEPSSTTNQQPTTDHVSDSTPATGISQGLVDLENDVNGFNQAIQYMKEAFIAQNTGGAAELNEKFKNEGGNNVTGDKKDIIKKKKTAKELLEAFKRTIESKEKLENKLVNYFTNYVCGDDC